jgi:NAD(P)-dependent dehydrogenase (short-subunit alcohol dehydrogenase family)
MKTLIHLTLSLLLLGPVTASPAQNTANIPDMSGKTILITGSTDGMGREVALRLGKLGAHMLIHGRNAKRGAKVVREITDSGGSAQFYQADFASLDNVRIMAAAVLHDHPRLDVLVNNAGLGSGYSPTERRLSQDGYEMLMQVNYLAHYLLTDLLLPALKAAAPSRIINVASRAQGAINFGDLMLENNYSGRAAYHRSKLAEVMHTFYYADLLKGTGVTFNTLHPASMMDTTMVSQMDAPARTTVDEGADVLMYLITSPELKDRSGIYFNQYEEGRADAQAYDPGARTTLDKMTRELVGLPPR